MPWAFLECVFFLDVAVWILTGFLRRDFSLSITFFGVFYAAVVVMVVRLAARRSIPAKLRGTGAPFVVTSWLWIAMVALVWGLNLMTSDTSTKGAAFDLLIPLSLAVAHLLVWAPPWNDRSWSRVVKVFVAVLAVDAIVSAVTVWLVNITGTIPSVAFFFNDRYPVILFHLGVHTYVRTPGIFESGGTNGSFLVIAGSATWAYALLAPRPLVRRLAAAVATLVLAALVVATLTRRSLLALVAMLFVIGALAALANRRYALAGLLGAGLVGGVGAVVFLLPGYFEAHSLGERLDFWAQNLNQIAELEPWRFLTGYGELQSSVDFTRRGGLALLDNGLIGLLVYGGIAYVGIVVWYYVKLFRVHVRLFLRGGEGQWKAASAIGLLAAVAVIAQFSVFFTNVTEALPCLIGINLLTRHLLESVPHDAPALGPAAVA